jgi:hypothetical protein
MGQFVGRAIVTDGLVFRIDAENKLCDDVTSIKSIFNISDSAIYQNGLVVVDGGLQFDGVDEVAYFNQSASAGDLGKFERTDSFSVEYLVDMDASDTGFQSLFGRDSRFNSGYISYRGWGVEYRAGKIRFFLDHKLTQLSAELNPDGVSVITSDTKYGKHHVIITYDGTSLASGVTMYVDGVEEVLVVEDDNLTGTIISTGFSNDVTFVVGQRYGGPSWYPTCNLKNISIYNKVLSVAEVAQNYEVQKHRYL